MFDEERKEMIWGIFVKAILYLTAILVTVHLANHFWYE